MGDYNERVNKRLRTVDNREEKTLDQTQTDAQKESDLYEHVKQGEERYDTQTYGEDSCTIMYILTFIFCKMHLLIQKHWAVALMWGRFLSM